MTLPLPGQVKDVTTQQSLDEIAKQFPIRRSADWINVKDYGAKGDGTTDDTAAINAATAAITSITASDASIADYLTGGVLYFPYGRYLYTGSVLWDHTALAVNNINIVGDGPGSSEIMLSAGAYLITNTAQNVVNLRIEGLAIVGGKGIFRDTRTGTNVLRPAIVRDCEFINYTEAAFNINASDWPYWRFENCMFSCDSATDRPIGIAMVNPSASAQVIHCNFYQQYIDIKSGSQGQGLKVRDCDLVPGAKPTGTARYPIWLVPGAGSSGAVVGEIAGNKFGNENQAAGDHVILFADEGAGTTVVDRAPVLNADSTAQIVGLKVGPNGFFGNATWEAGGGTDTQYIYSTTPELYACDFGPLTAWGVPADMVLRLRTAANIVDGRGNTIGPLYTNGFSAVAISNATNDVGAINPNGNLNPLSSVTAAANITLPNGADVITVNGNTNITSVTISRKDRTVKLIFTGTPTFTDGSNLKLAGNLVATADDTITLACDGTNWYETGRSVN